MILARHVLSMTTVCLCTRQATLCYSMTLCISTCSTVFLSLRNNCVLNSLTKTTCHGICTILLPILIGKKECRGTLFLAYVKAAMGPHKQCGGTLAACLLHIGKKECRDTLFLPHSRINVGSNQLQNKTYGHERPQLMLFFFFSKHSVMSNQNSNCFDK